MKQAGTEINSVGQGKVPAAVSRRSRLALNVAAVLTGVAMTAGMNAYAADDQVVNELKAEIARLKQELAAQKAASGAGQAEAGAARADAPAAPEPEAAAASVARADEPQALDAIVIRSRNRIERLQDVPLSVSVVTGKELDRLDATDISAITRRAGNITWNQGNQRTSSLSIRGIGKQGQTEAQDPAVGLIVDGVSYAYNALASSYDFTDVDTVEVARGPQGTLLGKNSSLGSVVVTTKRPTFTPSADASVTFGDRDTVKGKAALGGPIIDGLLAWRGTFSASKARGDIVNAYNRDLTYTNTDRLSGRAQFLLTPSADFTARISVDATPRAGEFTNGRTINTPTPTRYSNGTVNNLASDNVTRLNRRWFAQSGFTPASFYLYGGVDGNSVTNDGARPLVTGSNGATAELNWNVTGHTLTSITAYKNYHFNAVNDEGTPFDVNRNSGGFRNDYKQWSQELRLTSETGGFVDYQGGVYLIDVRNLNDYQKVWGNDAGAWFANAGQYGRLDADGNGRYLMQNSLSGLSMAFNSPAGAQDIRNTSQAIFGQANWHPSDALTLTTGLRITHENRRNRASSFIKNNGNAPELNPDVVNGVQLGGFASNATTGALLAGNTAAQLALADATALKYFGAPTYAGLNAAQQKQVADAKAIRKSQIGVVFNETDAQPFSAYQPSFTISPSYKVNEDLTVYASLQHGQKAGVAQFTNGVSNPVRAEKTTAYELGFKSSLLDNTLVFNAAAFLMNVKDYQQTTRVVDQYNTLLGTCGAPTCYTNATGNVPGVRAQGLEIDGVYSGISNTTIRFSGAYNDARYTNFTSAGQPVENGYAGASPYRDVTGRTLPGAAKWTGNVGVDYRKPFFDNLDLRTSFNVAFTSRFNSDVSLSDYAWIGGSAITDFSIGLGKKDQSVEGSLLVKNLFDSQRPLARTWNSYTPAQPRWIGVLLSGKL